MSLRLLSAALLSALSLSAFAAPVEYTFDPTHTQVEASYNHFGYSNITLRFEEVEGTLVYDAENPGASSAKATIQIGSVDSGVDKLDAHLESADFFDAAQFASATFTSTKVEAAGEGKLKMSGDLTIHGVTKPVTFDVSINKVGEHPMKKVPAAGFDAHATIKRSDFGLGLYAPNVSDEVKLEITVEATAKPAA
jgi:polyisoprenoid-binding protein YceI